MATTLKPRQLDIEALLGWIIDTFTWAYGSYSSTTNQGTITMSGDKTAIFEVGTKVRFKQGGSYIYAAVLSANYSNPTTTVTLLFKDGDSMSNTTFTNTYHSYFNSPFGYPANGVMRNPVKLYDKVVSGSAVASIDIQSIPGNFRNLRLVWAVRGTASGEVGMNLQFNNDTGSNYDSQDIESTNTTVSGTQTQAATKMNFASVPGSSNTAGYFGQGELLIPNYSASNTDKVSLARNLRKPNNNSGSMHNENKMGSWRTVNAAITRLTITLDSGNIDVGSVFTLYAEP